MSGHRLDSKCGFWIGIVCEGGELNMRSLVWILQHFLHAIICLRELDWLRDDINRSAKQLLGHRWTLQRCRWNSQWASGIDIVGQIEEVDIGLLIAEVYSCKLGLCAMLEWNPTPGRKDVTVLARDVVWPQIKGRTNQYLRNEAISGERTQLLFYKFTLTIIHRAQLYDRITSFPPTFYTDSAATGPDSTNDAYYGLRAVHGT
ncbi:hypothetical protein BDZ94DRAFT_1242312 [Collybia nuda]|uniref:Uncharacterized protein n=1 Tax=Collybia nuda TaxID=64659 RepID=A0A9P5XR25_9AGAR|nr:hypothetical protein BDZ94DRAFT_1242312 [Collybia nuda]